MPIPGHRYPGLLQPSGIPRIYGGGVEGRALGMAPPGVPVTPQGGLLQPVVFDRLRAQRGMGLLGTEGAPMMRGGGYGRSAIEMEPKAAPKGKMPASKFRWTRDPDGGDYTTVTPSGVKVYMEPRGGGSTEVSFFQNYERAVASGTFGSKGTKRSLDRFSEVFNAVTDFVKKHPGTNTLKFSAAGPSHEKLYKILAPKMAKELGGTHTFSNGYWKIFLPPPKVP